MARTKPVESLTEACESGDQRRALEAMRRSLAAAMQVAEPAVVAQIAGRLQAVLTELAALPTGREVSESDDLRKRVASRLADANVAPLAGRRRPVAG